MDTEKHVSSELDRDIPFSRTVKAGKRMYYIDVKRSKSGEYYLSMTESKKIVSGTEDNMKVTYEKHKLFVYPEDFGKIMTALDEAVQFVEDKQGKAEPRAEMADNDIHIDLDF